MSSSDGELGSDTGSPPKMEVATKKPKDILAVLEDEEARLREQLLKKRSHAPLPTISTGPTRTVSSEQSATSAGGTASKHKKSKKEKTKKHHSPIRPPMEKSRSVSPLTVTVPVVETKSRDVQILDYDDEDDALPIRPPQAVSATSESFSSSKHKKHHRRHHKKRARSRDKDAAAGWHIGVRTEENPEIKRSRVEDGWRRWKQDTVSGRGGNPYEQRDKQRRNQRGGDGHRGRGAFHPSERGGTKTGGARDTHLRSPSASRKRGSRSPSRKSGEKSAKQEGERKDGGRSKSSDKRSGQKKQADSQSVSEQQQTTSLDAGGKNATEQTSEHAARKPTPAGRGAGTAEEGGKLNISSGGGTPTMDEVEDREKRGVEGSEESSSESEESSDSPSSDSESGEESDQENGKKVRTGKEWIGNKYSKFESSPDEHAAESIEDGELEEARFQQLDPTAKKEGPPMEEGEEPPSPDGEEEENEADDLMEDEDSSVNDLQFLPTYFPGIAGCRSVEEFHCLNRIEEGTYGVVYRAKEKRTDEVVALKRLKMEKEKEGFPITSLREINMLLKAGGHENIVNVREIVVGSNMDKIYLVMDYIEHDMKCLMESMKQPFLVGEVKTLMRQLMAGVHHLHDNWILHRDLKTSNLLLSHKGILKIGDFGLAREYGSPLKPYTPIVVTLWYRAPELLLGIKEYSTAIDMWSVGCIFGEFLTLKPMFPGRGEMDAINRIFKMLGTPSESIWPGYSELPAVKKMTFADFPYNQLRKHFGATLSDSGFGLMNKFLTYNPSRRISAYAALQHDWFAEEPRPVRPDMFPTWPAKSELGKHPSSNPKKIEASPKPPSGGKQFSKELDEADEGLLKELMLQPSQASKGFSLRFDPPKF